MMETYVTITLPRASWQALLDVIPEHARQWGPRGERAFAAVQVISHAANATTTVETYVSGPGDP